MSNRSQAVATPSLRAALPEDEAFLFRLFAEHRAPDFLAAGLPPHQVSQLLQSQFSLRQRSYGARYPQSLDRIAMEETGVAAGRVLLAWSDVDDPPVGNIVDIAVLTGHQGRGIGGAMLEACIAEARQRGAQLRLSVDHWNPAQHLYVRHGFKPVGKTERQLQMQLDCTLLS